MTFMAAEVLPQTLHNKIDIVMVISLIHVVQWHKPSYKYRGQHLHLHKLKLVLTSLNSCTELFFTNLSATYEKGFMCCQIPNAYTPKPQPPAPWIPHFFPLLLSLLRRLGSIQLPVAILVLSQRGETLLKVNCLGKNTRK